MTDTEQFPVTTGLDAEVAALLKRDDAGLVPAIVQDATSGRVLMMAWMDDEALHRTLTTGRGTYWSRSRNRLWVKGEESGHVQWVRGVKLDCDGDTLLVTVDQVGPACHTGDRTCFDSHVLLSDSAEVARAKGEPRPDTQDESAPDAPPAEGER